MAQYGERGAARVACPMLIRLVYASRSTDCSAHDLPAILEWSRRVNPELEVTGVLCYLDGIYMQYLEGEESKVDALFKSIRADRRHGSVTLLERRAISKRAFPEWSMALLEWDDNTRGIFRSFSPDAKLDFYAADPSTAAPMLRALVRAPGWKLT
ncbi:BLUF domain-containing protein [Variovorax arabinosiphilus]|uniref:BLUF domain-containing protein n=1 Tax=Variovorax arabinosiphilus TaxID=3053498 RepID=UPI0025771019|nr:MULTISPECIES: BLUF domain-containing protein [unclassified Variovorax]MDM0118222.1 BLUF domain-containing protein [Variovorax sp. J2L1-78]MDM0128647.1 BLUF domain-containing protein [Variovorax sp. J2L1-63]MDM0233567.1 BLUF domain-containing protein [Variovorax sp. J2R1-6]